MSPLHGGVEQAVQFVEFSFGVQLREEGKRRHAHALSDHAKRHLHQRLGVVQPGDRGGLQIGAKPADDPVVGEGQR